LVSVRPLGILLTLSLTAAVVGLASPAQATFPGRNGRIAFDSDLFGGTHNIFTMNPDGSDVKQLTFLTVDQGAALRQSWSPDGSSLVFEQRNADQSVRQLYLMNADGSNQHLLFNEPTFTDHDPGFSPDGRRVVFSRCRQDNEACAIYTIKADGHHLTAVTRFDRRHNVLDSSPEYSPDGKAIAFNSFNRGGVEGAVYLVKPNGTGVRRITPRKIQAFEPDWSPDGTEIAFSSNCCNPRPSAIWTMNADGSGLQHLTFPALEDHATQFSPKGNRIVFERVFSNYTTSNIMTMNADGSGVTTIQTNAFSPSWGPSRGDDDGVGR
jgi:TolB protein